jgi:hypothetical protein
MAGLAVLILGLLAVCGIYTQPLTLIALLVAGSAILLTGSTLSATMIGFMRSSAFARVANSCVARIGYTEFAQHTPLHRTAPRTRVNRALPHRRANIPISVCPTDALEPRLGARQPRVYRLWAVITR